MKRSTKLIAITALALLCVSCIYAPMQVHDFKGRFTSAPYELVFSPSRDTRLDFGRLGLTWLAIAALAGVTLLTLTIKTPRIESQRPRLGTVGDNQDMVTLK